MSKLSISLEWFLQEDELKPDVFSKNHKIEINNNFFNAGSAPEYGGNKRNLNPEIYFAPYDQIEQEVYNVNSKIYQKSNDVIVLAIRLENLLSELFTDLIYNDRKFKKKISEIKKRIFNLIKQIRNKNTLSKIIFFNFNYIEKDLQSFTSTATNTNLDSLVEEINSYLISLTRKFNSFYIFDFKKVSQNFGLNNFFDKKLFLLSRMPFSLDNLLAKTICLANFFIEFLGRSSMSIAFGR